MERFELEQVATEHPRLRGSCNGGGIDFAIRKAVVLPRIRALVTGNALGCYAATFLGCDLGEWIGDQIASRHGPSRKPFTLSKVTIVGQTSNRVVADVTETDADDVSDGVAEVQVSEEVSRPITEAEAALIKDSSRYTIILGKDGVWRISDRKPSFDWDCKGTPVRAASDRGSRADSKVRNTAR
jgi:hypothetical protein